jgi:Protein kinase domain
VPIATGSRLGQYEVQDFIGEGAMGRVFRAYHAQLERTGAVKVMLAISPDADTVARFRREAQAIAKMRHPNIVDVYDFGESDGVPYMIVEYVPGGSLSTRMAEGRLNQATAIKYLRGIAAGLDYAHSHGVVHRDVKPANVLLTADDTPVLADFGLAKLLHGSSVKSMTGVTTGTPAYMAPEQVTGSMVGPPADRYALATIAYEMLTGLIPFEGEALMELLYAQVHREPMPPTARNPRLPRQVDAVIMRGLAKDPAARWDSCSAFVEALASALTAPAPIVEKTVVMAPFTSTVPLPGAAVAKGVAAAARPPVVATPRKRRLWRRLAFAAGGILVLVLAFGVCVALTAPTLALNPSTAALGQVVQVSGSNVPAHQPGSVQLHSDVRVFAFTADANGRVKVYITVPLDIAIGDHRVDLCWNATCHASASLHVVAGTGKFAPTPSATSTPISTSRPSPTPPVISVTNFEIKLHTGTETVEGLHFSPGSRITVTFKQGSSAGKVVGIATASSGGYWSVSFTVPADAVVGYALITACGTGNGCYDATVRVIA